MPHMGKGVALVAQVAPPVYSVYMSTLPSQIAEMSTLVSTQQNVVCVELSHRHPYGSGGFWYRDRRSEVCSFWVAAYVIEGMSGATANVRLYHKRMA